MENSVSDAVGWQASTADILDAGVAARLPVPFNARVRARDLEAQLAAARRFAWWPLIVGVVALAYDVSPLLRSGRESLLKVAVDEHSADASVNRAERTGDYWPSGAIYRPV